MSPLYLGDEMGASTGSDGPPKEKILSVMDCTLFCHGHSIEGVVDGKRRSYTGAEKVELGDDNITYRCRINAECPLIKVYEKAEL